IAEYACPDARNRHDAAGGRGGEDLIGFLECRARDCRYPCRDPHRSTELQNRFAGDAMQTAAIGRQDLPIPYKEDVEARSLGDETLRVAQYGRVIAMVMRLEEPGYEVAPLVILDGRIDRRIGYARRARDPQMGAALLHVLGDDIDPRQGI